MAELVHYQIGDSAWVVEGDPDFLKKHLNFGFLQDERGRIICTDYSLLYLCGRRIRKRRFKGRRSSEEVDAMQPFQNAMKCLKRNIRKQHVFFGLCPADKSKCRFWNDVFQVCSIARNDEAKIKENTPCSKLLNKEND